MKKMMSMAIAAVMGMMMSVNAMASSVAPIDPSEMNAMISTSHSDNAEALESRSMLFTNNQHTNKFVYVIDANGVVKSKTMYRYNNDTNEWKPVCIYRAVYGEDSNIIIRAQWNEADNAYTSNIATAIYSKSECPVLFKLPEIINY